jgi:enediyne polyketide synthase
MVLVGSSPPPDAATDTGTGGAKEIRQTLSKFTAEGLRCHYRQCNLAVRQDVERLVAKVRRDFGSVDVVVHGAGLNHPRRVDEPDHAEIIAEIGPKVAGALHLFDALSDTPPKMFVALTSIIGVIGMPHNAWYAFANQTLDRSLGRFAARHPSVEPLSLAYSIWDEVGMGKKLGSIERLGKLGIDAIPVEDGVARFVQLVTHNPGAREVIITGSLGGVDTWQPEMPPKPRVHHFLDDIVALEPGRELVCRTKLDLERDPYVRDHVYEGSYLLPAVFGMEAMAEAVAYVTGRAELPFPLSAENVELTRPLVVHPERGLQIEIRARVEAAELNAETEHHESNRAQRVHAEIRSHQTGYEQPHFSATFVLDGAAKPREQTGEIPTQALPIYPKEHLYGSVLFQGPRFQRIDELYALDEKRCMFAATQALTQESWLLGDPYFRDALLQSLQLCVVPDQCLPVRIDRWEIIEPTAERPSNRLSKAVITGKEGDTYVGAVTSRSATGEPIENILGYHARTLMRRSEWPDAKTLAKRALPLITELDEPLAARADARTLVNEPQPWDGSVFYRDVPGYGLEGQTAFFCRFPLSAQDSSSVSGSLSSPSYFRWAGKLREWGGMNTPGVYQGILEMLGSNEVMSATNECATRIFKVPHRNDLIEGRYWMEYVNKGDAGNIFEWWRIPFPSGEPEMIAWTRMRISAVKAIRHGVISSTDWPDFLYRFLKDMGDDAPEPTKGPPLDLDLGAPLFTKPSGPQPGVLLSEQTFSTSQEDSNVVGNIYFANYSAWQSRATDRFFHSIAPGYFEDRGARGELHRAETRISQLRDAMPFDEISVVMRLEELHQKGARIGYDFFRKEPKGTTKIAAGHSLVTWAKVERGTAPEIRNWPDEIRDAMLACVHERGGALQKYA